MPVAQAESGELAAGDEQASPPARGPAKAHDGSQVRFPSPMDTSAPSPPLTGLTAAFEMRCARPPRRPVPLAGRPPPGARYPGGLVHDRRDDIAAAIAQILATAPPGKPAPGGLPHSGSPTPRRRRHLPGWMRPRHTRVSPWFLPARARRSVTSRWAASASSPPGTTPLPRRRALASVFARRQPCPGQSFPNGPQRPPTSWLPWCPRVRRRGGRRPGQAFAAGAGRLRSLAALARRSGSTGVGMSRRGSESHPGHPGMGGKSPALVAPCGTTL